MRTTKRRALSMLKALVRRERSQLKAARLLGISAPFLCDILKGNRSPGPKVLAALGIPEEARGQEDGQEGSTPDRHRLRGSSRNVRRDPPE